MIKAKYVRPEVILFLLGMITNIFLSWITKVCHLPIYLDTIGTVTTAALLGTLPGVTVGFLTNCITAFLDASPNPMVLYYGILNVLIAVVISCMAKKGLLVKWKGKLTAILITGLIGGILGSGISWLLYGFTFGQGIGAELARMLYIHYRINEYTAQVMIDTIIDLVDKTITIGIFFSVVHMIPQSVMKKLPLGYLYVPFTAREESRQEQINYKRNSISTKITAMIVASVSVLIAVTIIIASFSYGKKLVSQYSDIGEYVVQMMLSKVDGNQTEEILKKGCLAEGYVETRQDLYDILLNARDIKYMYVYHIQSEGCRVIYDLDTREMPGVALGKIQKFDEAFPYKEELKEGKEIPPVITNGKYGWLLSIYEPVKNTEGKVVAYAAVDIDMQNIKADICVFIITIATLLIGLTILATIFIMRYSEKRFLNPIRILTLQARDFDFDGKKKGSRVRDFHTVNTGDELEEVFHTMCHTEDEMAIHIEELKKKNHEISQMQRNIIYTLANMVENRDGNTGGHIKRTASYVRLIGKQLRKRGLYKEIIDKTYIKRLYDSAPLHDIGKIKIPDSILNKPGKLTSEEYESMKLHTIEGRNIIKESLVQIEDESWLSIAVDMSMYHHEKWDGSGYPEGLSGKQIPLCARIMAVADVFDALVSARSYKEAYSFENAIEIIRQEAGKHFDPVIAEVFIESRGKIQDIMSA